MFGTAQQFVPTLPMVVLVAASALRLTQTRKVAILCVHAAAAFSVQSGLVSTSQIVITSS